VTTRSPIDWFDPPLFADDDALRARLRGKRVAIAGGDGFLGTNCIRGLASMGVEITTVSRRERPTAPAHVTRAVRGDLMDRAIAEEAIRDQDIVFDFLGYPKLSPSSREPQRELEQEFIPHLNLFLAAARSPSKPLLVLCSTRLVYGTPRYLPVDEAHPVIARSFYATHKLMLEQDLNVVAQAEGLSRNVLRLSSPYGPHAPSRSGSYGVLNMFMHMALRGETIRIFGDGSQERDYVYVDDVIHAFLCAAAEEKCVGETLNFGGDRGISLGQAAASIVRIAGRGRVEHVPWPTAERSMETGSYRSDLTKIRSVIGSRPMLGFQDGLHRTIEHAARYVAETGS